MKYMRPAAIIALPLLLSVVCSLQVQAESDSSLFGTEAERLVSRGLRHYNNQDYGAAFRCFRQAAETGDAYAQYNLGLCYHKGEGVEKNLREAKKWYRKAADQGYVYAQYCLAELRHRGEDGEKDVSEAMRWYHAAAEQGYEPAKEALRNLENEKELSQADDLVSKGKTFLDNQEYHDAVECFRIAAQMRNAQAMYYLGLCYEKGLGVEQDAAEAEKWIRKAAEQGDADALQALQKIEPPSSTSEAAQLVDKGVEHHENKEYEQAAECFRQAAEMGHAGAQSNLGVYYENGWGVPKDAAEAVKWFRAAAEQGHAVAQSNLGVYYENGWGVPKDAAEAVKWFRAAAEQGNAGAQFNLGVCYGKGFGVEQDVAEAVKWWRKAAEQGHADALQALQKIEQPSPTSEAAQLVDKGVEHHENKEYEQAAECFRQAAEQGHAVAQSNLGVYYENGWGVPKDAAEAVKWYRAAAEQGNAGAQFNLALCYRNGRGVPKDEAEAVKWYRAAAEQGDAEAQYLLGTLYIMGIGVDKDAAEAEKWFRAAAEQGNADAQDALKQFEDVRVLLRRARQGDAESQYKLAVKYERSLAVNTDEKEAIFWYRKAAGQGHQLAKFALSSRAFNILLKYAREAKGDRVEMMCRYFVVAYRYEYGIGTKKNMEKARYWYKKAAEEGHYRSKQKLQEMGRE